MISRACAMPALQNLVELPFFLEKLTPAQRKGLAQYLKLS